jgi:hypothetical protein
MSYNRQQQLRVRQTHTHVRTPTKHLRAIKQTQCIRERHVVQQTATTATESNNTIAAELSKTQATVKHTATSIAS